MWGKCSTDGAQLHCEDARQRLLAQLPTSYRALCKLRGGALREPFIALLRSVWQDQALRVAEAIAGQRSMGTCAEWQKKIWQHIDQATQEECIACVVARARERGNVERRLGPELRSLARSFFHVAK